MKYLGEKHIEAIKLNWEQLVDCIDNATKYFGQNDFSQPIKPYLRYNDLTNRIIAMPAYIGGEIGAAGIKWIASFPKNLEKNIKRAHSVIILNEENTGVPYAIINTPKVSGIRTASVTGSIIRKYLSLQTDAQKAFEVGIIGFGPIGQLHLDMIDSLMGNKVSKYKIYDLRSDVFDQIPQNLAHKVEVVNTWEEAYDNADVFCTCTVSKAPYIDRKPKQGSLQLNV